MKKHASTRVSDDSQTTTAPPAPDVRQSPIDNQSRLDALGDCGHVVVQGDTLSGLSETYLGEMMAWPSLYEVNQDIVGEDPDLILPGQVLDVCNETLLTGEAGGSEESQELATAADEQSPSTFVDVAIDLFPTLDSDEDGFVSEADLDAAMANGELSVDQAAALVTLRRMRGELEELSNDEWFDENSGVTLDDLAAYQNSGELPEGLGEQVEGQYAYRQARIGNASTELFASEDGLPHLEAMQQGGIGDCYFLAALGSAVAQNPEAVRDMIVPEEDGTYTVTFPDGRSANVQAPTLAEIGTFGTSGGDGMWVTLMEKAAGRIYDEDAVVPSDEMDGGSALSRAGTQLFSADGSSNYDWNGLTDNDTTRDRMESAFAEGRTVVAHRNRDFNTENRAEGLPGNHAYTVVGYDRDSDTVTLRNPWGRQEHENGEGQPVDGVDDGTFTLTLDEYDRLFSGTNYSNSGFADE